MRGFTASGAMETSGCSYLGKIERMIRGLLSKLRCPVCKNVLELVPFQEETVRLSAASRPSTRRHDACPEQDLSVIKEGVLLCAKCKVWYPIAGYVPVMLIFKTTFHERFAKRHASHVHEIEGYILPKWQPETGERDIQRTFTEEWDTLQSDDLCWTYTKDELKLVHQKAFLKWPETPPPNLESILNVGVGFGAEAEALFDISGAEVFGVDLNFSLLQSGAVFLRKPYIHLMVASLFHLPFEPSSFDLVYSVGVLHHTYSTYEAFKAISSYVKPGGQIFIWLYAIEDIIYKGGLAGFFITAFHLTQVVGRPILSRSPSWIRNAVISLLSIVLHPLFWMNAEHKKMWKLKNTNHTLRDAYTPRFRHSHGFNEVVEWFETLGFACELPSPLTYRKLFGKRFYGIGLLGCRGQNDLSGPAQSARLVSAATQR